MSVPEFFRIRLDMIILMYQWSTMLIIQYMNCFYMVIWIRSNGKRSLSESDLYVMIFKRYTVRDGNIKSALEDMYLTKTLQRLDKLRSNVLFKSFFDKTITVNGREYKSLNQVMRILENVIPQMLYGCWHI